MQKIWVIRSRLERGTPVQKIILFTFSLMLVTTTPAQSEVLVTIGIETPRSYESLRWNIETVVDLTMTAAIVAYEVKTYEENEKQIQDLGRRILNTDIEIEQTRVSLEVREAMKKSPMFANWADNFVTRWQARQKLESIDEKNEEVNDLARQRYLVIQENNVIRGGSLEVVEHNIILARYPVNTLAQVAVAGIRLIQENPLLVDTSGEFLQHRMHLDKDIFNQLFDYFSVFGKDEIVAQLTKYREFRLQASRARAPRFRE